MMRWWENDVFLKRRTTSEDEVLKLREDLILEEDAKIASEVRSLRKYMFRVEAFTSRLERVGVTGNCSELGSWEPDKIVLLDKEGTSKIWSKDVMLPMLTKTKLKYRYVIVTDENYSEENTKNVNVAPAIKSVRRWEASHVLRKINPISGSFQATCSFRKEYLSMSEQALRDYRREKTGPPPPEKFGFVRDTETVEPGWLTCDSVLQIKLFAKTMRFSDEKLAKTPIYTKIRTIKMKPGTVTDEDFCEDPHDGWPIIEVSELSENSRAFRRQSEYGLRRCGDENVIFNIFHEPTERPGILMEFYSYTRGKNKCEDGDTKPYHAGVACLHPCMMADSEGEMSTDILNIRGSIIGDITLKYVFITGLKQIKCRFNYSLPSVWKTIWTPLITNNRIKTCAETRDNTISSIEATVSEGFNYVEIVIQFTKDRIPIFSHSKYIVVVIKYPHNLFPMKQYQVKVDQFTLAELHRMRILPIQECDNVLKLRGKSYSLDEWDRPFPTLMQLLNGVDKNVGLIVEFDTMTQLQDGIYESYLQSDLKEKCERLLKTLKQSAGRRDLILTSFHPDVCTMLRMKQNLYPVIFLQDGIPSRYPGYDQDVRCKNLERAAHFAVSIGIHGLGVDDETIMASNNADRIRKDGLVAFCTEDRDEASEKKLRDHLTEREINGILCTRRDEYGTFRRTFRFIFEPKKNESKFIDECAEDIFNDGYMKPKVHPLEFPKSIIVDLENTTQLELNHLPASQSFYGNIPVQVEKEDRAPTKLSIV